MIETPHPTSAADALPLPAEQGFRWPAEWEEQAGVLLSYPLNPETWPGASRAPMEKAYAAFAALITRYERLWLNCQADAQHRVEDLLAAAGTVMDRLTFLNIPTNDAWCRDHGPIVLKNADGERAVLDFQYNSWGGKFPPWDLDDAVPERFARQFSWRRFRLPLVCEGGALEVNGAGTLLTTSAVVLNSNRNPDLSRTEAERWLRGALGVEQVLWLRHALPGDDTDGHIDTLARFAGTATVLTQTRDSENLAILKQARLPSGERLTLVPLPQPERICPGGWRVDVLPASYANYLILNGAVLVPTYRQDKADAAALEIIAQAYPGRAVHAVDCCDILLEGGALHCLSQQICR